MIPGVEMWKQVWSTMDHPLPTLAERTHVARNWTEYENLIKLHVFEKDSNQLSILFLIHDINPTFIREHMQSLDFYTGGTKDWQERLEPLGTDPGTHCSFQVSTIHLWETGTLATRNGLSMREVPLAYFMSFYKNIFVRFWPHIC